MAQVGSVFGGGPQQQQQQPVFGGGPGLVPQQQQQQQQAPMPTQQRLNEMGILDAPQEAPVVDKAQMEQVLQQYVHMREQNKGKKKVSGAEKQMKRQMEAIVIRFMDDNHIPFIQAGKWFIVVEEKIAKKSIASFNVQKALYKEFHAMGQCNRDNPDQSAEAWAHYLQEVKNLLGVRTRTIAFKKQQPVQAMLGGLRQMSASAMGPGGPAGQARPLGGGLFGGPPPPMQQQQSVFSGMQQ